MYECKNDLCFHYDKKRFCYACRICDRKGSPAYLSECRVNARLKEKNLAKEKKLKELFKGVL
ncbi:MAG: hypothetical protein ACOC80_10295 [Petrotogales bacterium]